LREQAARDARLEAETRQWIADFNARADAEQRERLARIDREIAASRKCRIAFNKLTIGMTDREAVPLACNLESINSNTTLRGTSEQWVYGPGHYVYFEGGRVVAIQRHRE